MASGSQGRSLYPALLTWEPVLRQRQRHLLSTWFPFCTAWGWRAEWGIDTEKTHKQPWRCDLAREIHLDQNSFLGDNWLGGIVVSLWYSALCEIYKGYKGLKQVLKLLICFQRAQIWLIVGLSFCWVVSASLSKRWIAYGQGEVGGQGFSPLNSSNRYSFINASMNIHCKLLVSGRLTGLRLVLACS